MEDNEIVKVDLMKYDAMLEIETKYNILVRTIFDVADINYRNDLIIIDTADRIMNTLKVLERGTYDKTLKLINEKLNENRKEEKNE